MVRCAGFVAAFLPEFVVLENARELIQGNHSHHYKAFVQLLEQLNYSVQGDVYTLTHYGLPQIRQRAIVIASRIGSVKTLDDLWEGRVVSKRALTVRRVIGHMNRRRLEAGTSDSDDSLHYAPRFKSGRVRERIAAIPHDGGSWRDLLRRKRFKTLLIPSMKAKVKKKDVRSHSDVYGRLRWDRPAVTIKRECAHVGNGRYAHPEQTRLLTIREMSILQGFPKRYKFSAGAVDNRYRHIGDAVPPLISYQLSALVAWMKTGDRPGPRDWVLSGTSLRTTDIRRARSNYPRPRLRSSS